MLLDFDGRTRTWTTTQRPMRNRIELDRGSNPVRYTVTVEPHNRRWLFALDMPGTLPPRADVSADYLLLSQAPVNSRMRYEIESYLDYRIGADSSPATLRRMLLLPQSFNPQTRELGRKLREQHGGNEKTTTTATTAQSIRDSPARRYDDTLHG